MSDQTAAANLEITSALAEAAEEILRDFAENAELDVALVVDHSGGLIAGISADDDVNVETVGALVAGTVGSIRALGKAVGETKALESMHHGEEVTIYLRELNERFIVVGTAESSLPAGIIREVGSRIAKPLLGVLLGEEIVEKSDSEDLAGGDEVNFQGEPEDENDDNVESPEVSESFLEADEIIEEKKAVVPPVVVDSPFEFVDDDGHFGDEGSEEAEFVADDSDPADDASEEEEEGIAADGIIFEIGVDDEPVAEDAPDSIFELGDDSEDEIDETGVAAPLLISPMMPTPEQVRIEIEEDATTSVAAITTPIATDISKKNEIPAPAADDVSQEASDSVDEEVVDDIEDDEEDEPVGGPRYVFEIG